MSWNSSLSSLRALVFGSSRRSSSRSQRRPSKLRTRLSLEALEDRLVPATIAPVAADGLLGLVTPLVQNFNQAVSSSHGQLNQAVSSAIGQLGSVAPANVVNLAGIPGSLPASIRDSLPANISGSDLASIRDSLPASIRNFDFASIRGSDLASIRDGLPASIRDSLPASIRESDLPALDRLFISLGGQDVTPAKVTGDVTPAKVTGDVVPAKITGDAVNSLESLLAGGRSQVIR